MFQHEAMSSDRSQAPLPDCIPTHPKGSPVRQPHSSLDSSLGSPSSHPSTPSRPMTVQDLQKSIDSIHLRSPLKEAVSPARSPMKEISSSVQSPLKEVSSFVRSPLNPQYDLYKREPHSQVSSSTDSGYGHNNLMDSSRSFSGRFLQACR